MAATQALPVPSPMISTDANQSSRQAIVDSVLGTMQAEGEPPSAEAQLLMHRFVLGELSLDEMTEAILAHATRMVHEANAARLTVR